MNIRVITDVERIEMLLQPMTHGLADSLHILSGYAGAGVASRHLHELGSLELPFKLSLVVGMTIDGAVTKNAHGLFKRLASVDYKNAFSCRYLPIDRPSHSKIYTWTKKGKPVLAWCSSANYSQAALYSFNQQEVLASCDPAQAYQIFKEAFTHSVDCNAPSAEALAFGVPRRKAKPTLVHQPEATEDLSGLPKTSLSLLAVRTGKVHNAGAGINWGQRGTRNRSEAYIPIPAPIGRSEFFPKRGTYFSVRTEAGLVMTCVRVQDQGKSIATPLDNSELGRWLRTEAGVSEGAFVTTEQLISTGTQELEFIKLGSEEFLVRFPGKRV